MLRAWGLLWAQGAEKQRDGELARKAERMLRGSLQRAGNDVDVLDALATLLVRVAMKQALPAFEGDELHPAELLPELAAQLAAIRKLRGKR